MKEIKMGLVHVCTDQQPHVWRKLGANAKLSGVPLRDFLAYLILSSAPVSEDGSLAHHQLQDIVQSNRAARSAASSKATRIQKSSKPFNEGDEGNAENERAEQIDQVMTVEKLSSGFLRQRNRRPSALDVLKQHIALAEKIDHLPTAEPDHESDSV